MRFILVGGALLATHGLWPSLGMADNAVLLGLALSAIGFGRILGNHLHQ